MEIHYTTQKNQIETLKRRWKIEEPDLQSVWFLYSANPCTHIEQHIDKLPHTQSSQQETVQLAARSWQEYVE